jgi:arylsulfatase A-like enzyme
MRKTIHTCLLLVVFLCGGNSIAAAAVVRPSTFTPPHVLVILTDDMGWADLGHDGSQIDTPHLDQLARDGMKLTRFYASAPMCSPTRAALLTGRYPHSVGMPELASQNRRGNVPVLALSHDAITIPEALKPAGFRSIVVGKWHLGFTEADRPSTHGFDEFWGSLLGTPNFWQPKETYHNNTPIKVHGHYTDVLTDKVVEFLLSHDANTTPLFLFLSYNAPHYPLEAPPELVLKYRRRFPDRGFFAIHAAMVEQLDTGIGRVLATLQEKGMTDNTLVMFMSDNGPSAEPPALGPEGAKYSSGPLREQKFSTHEGGIRVPFLARWPGRIPAGLVRGEVGVTMDLLPTIMEAAALQPARGHEMHGVSILPLLRGEPFTRRDALHWENYWNSAVMLGEWKLVHQYWQPPRLYRIEEDIEESNDLAAKYPEKVAELLAMHERWKATHYPNPIPRELKRSTYAFPMRPGSDSSK